MRDNKDKDDDDDEDDEDDDDEDDDDGGGSGGGGRLPPAGGSPLPLAIAFRSLLLLLLQLLSLSLSRSLNSFTVRCADTRSRSSPFARVSPLHEEDAPHYLSLCLHLLPIEKTRGPREGIWPLTAPSVDRNRAIAWRTPRRITLEPVRPRDARDRRDATTASEIPRPLTVASPARGASLSFHLGPRFEIRFSDKGGPVDLRLRAGKQ